MLAGCMWHAKCMFQTPGVNFTDILSAAFWYVSYTCRLFALEIWVFYCSNQIGGKVDICSLNVGEPDGARKMPVWDPWFYQSTKRLLVVNPWRWSLMFLSFFVDLLSVDLCNLSFPPPHKKSLQCKTVNEVTADDDTRVKDSCLVVVIIVLDKLSGS